MNTAQPRGPAVPFSILVGLDFTDAGGFAFGQAARIARRIPGSHVHLAHAFDAAPAEKSAQELVGRLRTYVNEKASFVGGLSGSTVGIHLRVGEPAAAMVQLAGDVAADLIIIGSHKGPSMKAWLVGSVAEKLLAFAPCPVLVAGPTPPLRAKDHAPTIEPPCSDCLKVRGLSHGGAWWCERHRAHARKMHCFSYTRELPFEMHDSEVLPTGIDF